MKYPISETDLKKYKIPTKPICIEVQYTYLRDQTKKPTIQCWTPPVGWVYDWVKEAWIKTGVHKRAHRREECYWEVDSRFKKIKAWRKEETKNKKSNPDYVHPELQQFKEECWRNRLSGFWFYNNGEPTYITGQNWFYLSCWELDTGLPDFRMVDVEFFYMWDYCYNDKDSYGMVLLTKRRNGKTYMGGCLAYEQTSRQQRFRTGIQSKNDDDAYKVFEEHIFFPFKSLPFFFKPDKINLPPGKKAPATGLKFNSGSAEEDDDDDDNEELRSVIGFRSSKISAYDGYKLKYYYADEVGKCPDVDVYERWNTVRKCLVDNNYRVVGKSLQTTTVEDMEKGGGAFKKLWEASDQSNKKNGRTKSGLLKMFVPAFKTIETDKYGRCDEEAAKQFLMDERNRQDTQREKSIEIRQNPFYEEEAFRSDSSQCVFDSIKIDDRIEALTWIPEQYKRGNFHWVDGKRFGKVAFYPNPNGRTMLMEGPPEGRDNQVTERGGKYYPGNTESYCGGVDPYDHRQLAKESERFMSLGAFTVLKKDTPINKTIINGGPACFYLYRPDSPEAFYEDVLMAMWYFGCLALVETNKPGLLKYFEDNDCEGFIPYLSERNVRGIAATATTNTYIGELTDQFISEEWEEDGVKKHRIDTVFFIPLLNDWKKFTPSDTTDYDGAMAFGYALMLMKNGISRKAKPKTTKDITEYFSFMQKTSYGATR